MSEITHLKAENAKLRELVREAVDCAEIWCDETTGKRYIRCPYFMCDGWGKLRELVVEGER